MVVCLAIKFFTSNIIEKESTGSSKKQKDYLIFCKTFELWQFHPMKSSCGIPVKVSIGIITINGKYLKENKIIIQEILLASALIHA